MERGLLSDPALAASYDDVVWFYLYQDFSHNEEDRRAERSAVRFGISAWPQHLLIDPRDLEVLGDTGRELGSFRAAVAAAVVGGELAPSPDELARYDALAEEIASARSLKPAKANLAHSDRVVRYFAVTRLAEDAPKAIVEVAAELLATPHDQTRYAVCKVLRQHAKPDPTLARALEALVREPGPASRNPNVVRIHATQALATCGDGESLAVLRPWATSGDAFNGLTGAAIDAVTALGERLPKARSAAREVLLAAFPPAATPRSDGTPEETTRRMTKALAQRVHDALAQLGGSQPPFPDDYDEAARVALVEAWSRRIK